MYDKPFSPKQKDYILNANAKFNLAHGSVRSGKTVGVTYRFLQDAIVCPGDQIWLIGYTQDAIYQNVIRNCMDLSSKQFGAFAKFMTWMPGKRMLKFGDKNIYCLGASDESSIGQIQGKTFDLCYCNEMTLYPDNVIQMIATRLSMPHSKLHADMNPVQPTHTCKKWIDLAVDGDKNYYQLHWTLEDNPFLTDDYKKMQRQTLTGLFLKRNYYGEWCLAEGAIFDFFDHSIHVIPRPPTAAMLYIAAIDYGASNAFAALLIGINHGRNGQPALMWVEKEYYYDPKVTGRQKTNSEYASDLLDFLGECPLRSVYIDPSAASFKAELRKNQIHTVDADNDVYDGIIQMTNMVKNGQLVICKNCQNLIREIEAYVWDPKKSKLGIDAPFKQSDHAIDALRYAVKTYMKGKTDLKRFDEVNNENFGRTLGYRR